MLKKIEQQSLGTAYHTWLQSTFHFSVADYYKPLRQRFGIIRLINDDLIQPSSGYELHRHRFVNILTFVIKGELVHAVKGQAPDVLRENDVYYLQSGNLSEHSELNDSNEPVRLLQIGIAPHQKSTQSDYHILRGVGLTPSNQFEHVIGCRGSQAKLQVDEDLNVYVGNFDCVTTQVFNVLSNRQAYIIQLEGRSTINEIDLSSYDSLEVVEETLQLQMMPTSKVIILEVKKEAISSPNYDLAHNV